MDTGVLHEMGDGHRLFVTIEDAAVAGGYGDRVMRYVSEQNMGVKVLTMGVPDCFVEHGNIPQLREQIGLNSVSIVEKIEHAWENL
jgi:1-deoxy-D-xylulose-5-phosphate synthase